MGFAKDHRVSTCEASVCVSDGHNFLFFGKMSLGERVG